jgi:dCTP deaminase
MFAVQPVRIYPNIPICQVFYHQIQGQYQAYESDKYQHNRDIQPSLLFKELNPEAGREDPQLRLNFPIDEGNEA